MMRFITSFAGLLVLLIGAATFGQTRTPQANPQITSSPAYAETLLRKTELTAQIESLLVEFTDEYPKVAELRLELELLKVEMDRLLAVKSADSGKLSLALGKLILGKVGHAAALKRLQATLQDNHPNVRREKRQVEIYEAAIKEILN